MTWHCKYRWLIIVLCIVGCSQQSNENLAEIYFFDLPLDYISIDLPMDESTLRNLNPELDIRVSIDPTTSNASVMAAFTTLVEYGVCWRLYIGLTNGENIYFGFPLSDDHFTHPWYRSIDDIESVITFFVDERGVSVEGETIDFKKMKEYLKARLGSYDTQCVVLHLPPDGAWMYTDKALCVLEECGVYWYAFRRPRSDPGDFVVFVP